MNAADYFIAAIPEPYQILGLRLKPFCLGHFILMRRFQVAFASDDSTNAELSDLIMACLICSRDYADFLTYIDTPQFAEDVKSWGKQIGMGFELPERVQMFNSYMADAFAQPTVIYEGEPSESGAHWSHVLKCSLVSMGYSEREALNMPLPQAFSDFYRHAESNGTVTIVTPEIAELIRQSETDSSKEFLQPLQQSVPFIPPPEVRCG